MSQEFAQFMERIKALCPPQPAPAPRPQTDAAKIALLKAALDQFLLTPNMEKWVGRDAWEFALSVREDC